MAEMVTNGVWIVNEDNQAAFIDAWTDFATWASANDGAGSLRLGRDGGDPTRFISFAPWDSADQVHAWKATPEFRQRMAGILQHVAEFHPTELDVVATATNGNSSRSTTVSR